MNEAMIKHAMKTAQGGCTVFGHLDAQIFRKIQDENPDWIQFIESREEIEEILGDSITKQKYIPYFMAILKAPGQKAFDEME